MTIARRIVFWIFACCLPLLLIATTLTCEASSLKLYEYGFDKYKISQATGIDRSELTKVARHLIVFFNLEVESAQITVSKTGQKLSLFNERELIHLRDVRDLVQVGYWIQRWAFILIVVCVLLLLFWLKTGWRTLARCLVRGSLLTLSIMVFLTLWALIGFDRLFVMFHELSFSNEFWILDPTRDYLIMLFPGGFFYDATILAFGAVIFEALLIGGISMGALMVVKREK